MSAETFDFDSIYSDLGDEPFYGPYDYAPMLGSLPGEVMVQVDEDAYQGDSYVLFRDGDRWGYLTFGWGSCSGCDWLQGCRTREQLGELRDDLLGKTQWFDSAGECSEWIVARDWKLNDVYHAEELRTFIEEATTCLAANPSSQTTPDQEGKRK